jgi:hypothetical protein
MQHALVSYSRIPEIAGAIVRLRIPGVRVAAQHGGTPEGRLSRLEKDLLEKPWQQAGPVCRSSACRPMASCTCSPGARTV